jgi:hypothetical protein
MASCRPHNKTNILKIAPIKGHNAYPEWLIVQANTHEDHNIRAHVATFNNEGEYDVTCDGHHKLSCVGLHGDVIEREFADLSYTQQLHIHNECQDWWKQLMSEAYLIIRQNPDISQASYARIFNLGKYDDGRWTTYTILNKFKELGEVAQDGRKYSIISPFDYPVLTFHDANYSHRRSMGEARIAGWCERHPDVHYDQQVTFPGLRHRGRLYFDAQITLANGTDFLVEYDGIQHSRFIPYFHSTIAGYQDAQLRDRIKDIWAQDHDIPLLRIPWNEDVDQSIERFIHDL